MESCCTLACVTRNRNSGLIKRRLCVTLTQAIFQYTLSADITVCHIKRDPLPQLAVQIFNILIQWAFSLQTHFAFTQNYSFFSCLDYWEALNLALDVFLLKLQNMWFLIRRPQTLFVLVPYDISHPASCTMGTGSFPGVKCGRGVLLTTHPLLAPRSWKSRVIPLPPSGPQPGP